MKLEPQLLDPEQQQDDQERLRGQEKGRPSKRPRVLVTDDGGEGDGHGPLDDNGVHLQLVEKFQSTSVKQAIGLNNENLRSVITIIAALHEKEVRKKNGR